MSKLVKIFGAVILATVVTACGGGNKGGDTTPDMTATNTTTTAAPADDNTNTNTFSPDTMDQIQRALDRKRDSVARCLGEAVDNKELPKNAHGKVTLEIVIGTAGKTTSIKVIKTDLDSKTLAECVTHHVQEIEFPRVPQPYERSYTYGFEAM